MRYWLDGGKSLSAAANLALCDDETVLKWIPNVLETKEPAVQEKWIRLIRAQGKEKHLGKFSDV